MNGFAIVAGELLQQCSLLLVTLDQLGTTASCAPKHLYLCFFLLFVVKMKDLVERK